MQFIIIILAVMTVRYLALALYDLAFLVMVLIVLPPVLIWCYLVPERVKVWFRVYSWVPKTVAWIFCVVFPFWCVSWLSNLYGEPQTMIEYWMSQDASTLKVFIPFGVVLGSALWTEHFL